jgi:hypothetical protein
MLPPIPAGGNDAGGVQPQHRDRPANDIIGGYAYQPQQAPTVHGSLGSYGPGTAPSAVFDPYRDRDLRHILARMVNQGTIYDLQLALVQAGFLEDDANFGYIDDATSDALSDVLAIANQHGIVWQDVLSQSAAAGGAYGTASGGGGGQQLAPTVITLPNRDDVRKAQEDIGTNLTGERLDDDLLDGATDAVLDRLRTQQERQFQKELGFTGEGLYFTEGAPDAARLMEEQIRERAPGKVMAKGTRDAMDSWFAGLAGPVG